ncbi:MAG: hypothetical protein PUC53_03335 [Bacteroidales bacterium]|nr:hypothetical protein [Bacteroidales bacterium]
MKNSLDVLLFMAFAVSTHAQGNKSINPTYRYHNTRVVAKVPEKAAAGQYELNAELLGYKTFTKAYDINRAPGWDLDLGATGYGEQELYGADHSIRLLIPFWQAQRQQDPSGFELKEENGLLTYNHYYDKQKKTGAYRHPRIAHRSKSQRTGVNLPVNETHCRLS